MHAADADGKADIGIAINRKAADDILNVAHFERESVFLNLRENDQKFVAAISNEHIDVYKRQPVRSPTCPPG